MKNNLACRHERCEFYTNSEKNKSMSHKKKGQLTKSPERMKHLGRFLKRYFWKRERRAEKKEMDEDISTD